MSSFDKQIASMNLYNQSKNDHLGRIKTGKPAQDHRPVKFVPVQVASSSNNSIFSLDNIATLALVAGAGLAAYYGIKKLTGSSDSAQGPAAAANSSKSTLQALQTAESSTNVEGIQRAIEAGDAKSRELDGQIKTAEGAAQKIQTEVTNAKQNIDSLTQDISAQENAVKNLESELSGGKDSAGLASKEQAEIAAVPEMIPGDISGTRKNNPEHDAKVAEIKRRYESDLIPKAKEKEKQLAEKKAELDKKRQKLQTTKDVLSGKQEELNANNDKVKTLTPQRQQIIAQVEKLQQRLNDVQNATKSADNSTAAAPAAATPAPANTPAPAPAPQEDIVKKLTSTVNSASSPQEIADADKALAGAITDPKTSADATSELVKLQGILNAKKTGPTSINTGVPTPDARIA